MLNRILGAGQRAGVLAEPTLDPQALMARMAARTGLEDFGDPWFERPWAALVDALQHEARLNRIGLFLAQMQFKKVLQDRLWAQDWFARYPEIRTRPLRRPVVIVGPMRSGTTRLHRLLASDSRFAHMRSFETICPVPRPGFDDGVADARPRMVRQAMMVARLANPRTLDIHPTGPFEPEEELGLLVASMWGMKHEAQWMVPSYGRWCEAQDATPAYRYLADLLRLIGWSQGESSLRPWILKTPQHMLDLPALLAVFPDARLIFTHRDPHAVVGSAASLAWNQTMLHSDHADPHAVGREWLRKSRLQIERMRAARKAIPAERMIDVHYDEMDRDWRGTMERIYRFIGFDIEPARAGLEAYVARCARLKRHPHRYSLAEFGLSAGMVQDQLGDYVRSFDIPLEEDEAGARNRRIRRSG
ncbi:MAG: sulfotransferase [Sphingomonadales bacterium]|nr:sulfotransferase [Sphingomonadales bacterium]MBD3774016.1 sulfotransferase [Paracoccaceae bacterium]